MNILVTGGAGFIGSNLVKNLVHNHDVTVLDNLSFGVSKNIDSTHNVNFIQNTVDNIKNIETHYDLIYHLGIPSSSPMYMKHHNLIPEVVLSMVSVLEYVVEHNSKLVFASSSSLYNGNERPQKESMPIRVTDYYTEARLYCERLSELYCNLYNIDITALRLFSVYGHNETHKANYANLVSQFIWTMFQGNKPILYGSGEQTRDFIHVDDVVSAFILAGNHHIKGFAVYNVGCGVGYSFNHLVQMINSAMGTNLNSEYVQNHISNYVVDTQADTIKSKNELGFTTSVDIKDGIKDIILQLKAHK